MSEKKGEKRMYASTFYIKTHKILRDETLTAEEKLVGIARLFDEEESDMQIACITKLPFDMVQQAQRSLYEKGWFLA
jgi:hypothetical protein